jgi:co-chaperonin GroES (HSP10)
MNYKSIKAEDLIVQKGDFLGVVIDTLPITKKEETVKKRGRKPSKNTVLNIPNHTNFSLVEVIAVGEMSRSERNSYIKLKVGDKVIVNTYNCYTRPEKVVLYNEDPTVITGHFSLYDVVAKLK